MKVDGRLTTADGLSLDGAGYVIVCCVGPPQNGPVVYAVCEIISENNHSSGPNCRHLRSVVTRAFLHEAADMYDAGGHTRGALVRYIENKHDLFINFQSLRSRVAAHREKS